MVMRNREIGIDRALFVEIGTVAGGVIDAKTDNHASEFELVGDVSNLKEPLSQREIREINAGGLILYKPATRRVGTLEFTLQSYQSELVAAIGQLEAGGSVANPGEATAARTGSTTPKFVVREFSESNDGRARVTFHVVQGILSLWDPQSAPTDEVKTFNVVVHPTRLYSTLSQSVATGLPAIVAGDAENKKLADFYVDYNTGQVWAHGFEVSRRRRAGLGLT